MRPIWKTPSAGDSARRSVPGDEHGRWKATGKTVGEGGQAQVSIVEDTRKEYPGEWALKRLKNVADPKAKERFRQEVEAVRSINHPNILKIIDSDLTSTRPNYVAEYCQGGSLEKIGASVHTELDTPPYNTAPHVARCIRERADPFGKPINMQVKSLDETFPQYLLNNRSDFQQLIHPCGVEADAPMSRR